MPASREQKQSEKILKKAYDWFPLLFNEVWFLAGGTVRGDREWQESISQKIDYILEDMIALKKAIREENLPDYKVLSQGEKKLTPPISKGERWI